jgi:hypothetical protein
MFRFLSEYYLIQKRGLYNQVDDITLFLLPCWTIVRRVHLSNVKAIGCAIMKGLCIQNAFIDLSMGSTPLFCALSYKI